MLVRKSHIFTYSGRLIDYFYTFPITQNPHPTRPCLFFYDIILSEGRDHRHHILTLFGNFLPSIGSDLFATAVVQLVGTFALHAEG